MKPIRIAMLGLGVVGTGVAKLLHQNRQIIERKAGAPVQLVRVLVRDPKKARDAALPELHLVTDPAAVLESPDVDLVVEVMGGVHPAAAYIRRALAAGKPVVTANKDVIAEQGAAVFATARQRGVGVYFEAAVGGGIPIIRALQDSLAANRVSSILGIVNGTTNYILSRMSQDGLDFTSALRQAQELGFAEPDPTNDVEGKDAARKLAILASIAFGSPVSPDQVYAEGIAGVTAHEIKVGKRLGWTVKLLAVAQAEPDGISARVHPAFLPDRHPLASVHGSLNAIFVSGDAVGETMLMGRGAGAMPTASAVVGDILYAVQAMRQGGRPAGLHLPHRLRVIPPDELRCRYLVRILVRDEPGVLAEVARACDEAGVGIAHILHPPDYDFEEVFLVTHPVQAAPLQAAVSRLRQRPEVTKVDKPLRVEQ